MEAMGLGGVDFVLRARGLGRICGDVTGRLTGASGLCIATLGPGATNLTAGVRLARPLAAVTGGCQAWADRARVQ